MDTERTQVITQGQQNNVPILRDKNRNPAMQHYMKHGENNRGEQKHSALAHAAQNKNRRGEVMIC